MSRYEKIIGAAEITLKDIQYGQNLRRYRMKKKLLIGLATGALMILQGASASAATVAFGINKAYTQGIGVVDLPATSISLGGAGNFNLDPGGSGNYFDFQFQNTGTFSTINTQISGYYFLRSYAVGEVIGASNFGVNESVNNDWDTILVNGATAGVWGSSHRGYLGFVSDSNLYGWILYSFTKTATTSTLSFLNGAYNDVAGANIVAGAVPVPGAVWLFGSGVAGLIGMRKRKN